MIAVNARLFALITLLSITLFKYKTNSRTTGRSLSKFLSDTPSMLRIRYRDAFLKIRRSNAIWGNGLLSSFSKSSKYTFERISKRFVLRFPQTLSDRPLHQKYLLGPGKAVGSP